MEKHRCEQCDRNFASFKDLLQHNRSRDHARVRMTKAVDGVLNLIARKVTDDGQE